jgi:chromosome segregation ATPase
MGSRWMMWFVLSAPACSLHPPVGTPHEDPQVAELQAENDALVATVASLRLELATRDGGGPFTGSEADPAQTLRAESQRLGRELDQARARVGELQGQLQAQGAELEQQLAAKATLSEELACARTRVLELQAQLDTQGSLAADLEQARERANQLQAQLDAQGSLAADLERARHRVRNLEERVQRLRGEVVALGGTLGGDPSPGPSRQVMVVSGSYQGLRD